VAELWHGGPVVLPHSFTLDDVELTIPEIAPTTLVGWLAFGQWWSLFPHTVHTGMEVFNARFHDDDDAFDYEHLHDPATVIFGRMTGMAALHEGTDGWWPGRRIAYTALCEWPRYAAWCALHGQEPAGGQLYEIVPRMYAWLCERAGPGEGIQKLDAQIYEPPPYAAKLAEDEIPDWLRAEEAANALATLNERFPGE
jgi:hypothetical protein